MKSLRIEICNERLLPRFGVDRFLLLLGRHLLQNGFEASFTCLRCDESLLRLLQAEVEILALRQGLDIAGTEAAVWEQMAERWRQRRPDVIVSGGWPFFVTAARAASYGVRSIFLDAGAVAQDGLSGPALDIQRELRRIRQLTLPGMDRVLPISDFIRRTQSEPDRGDNRGVRTILLGADHLVSAPARPDGLDQQSVALLTNLDARVQAGEKLLLALGRFEPQGYKNSVAVYDLLRLVRNAVPETRLLILDAGQDCRVPRDLADCITPLGAPSDAALQEIMSRCAAGISPSLWEGFNLPVAEMQWLGRPCVALNVGAHPEIIADPWLLCHDLREMAAKTVRLLKNQAPVDFASSFAKLRGRLQWQNTLGRWEREILELADEGRGAENPNLGFPRSRRLVVVDVTSASADPANPGVIRVTRRLCAELQQHPALDLVFVAWRKQLQRYALLDSRRAQFLQSYGGPKDGFWLLSQTGRQLTIEQLLFNLSATRSHPSVLFLPEVVLDGQAAERISWARTQGLRQAALVYDLIPVFHQELCDPGLVDRFPAYLQALAQTDAVWSISDFTLQQLQTYITGQQRKMPAVNETVWLPGQFGAERPRADDGVSPAEIRILCVSTLEPRKNHLRLLQAFEILQERRPELPVRLVLIGNRYAGAPQIADQVQATCRRNPSIEWQGPIDDDRLTAEFHRAAFTVYPSTIEGFGLPILESLWMARPCLTHCGGVMRELAAGGGCLMVNMTDTQALASALEQLAADANLRKQLGREARNRHIATWQEYAAEIAGRLLRL